MAEIGPLTPVMEALAAAIGAGMLLGGFGTGSVGTVYGWNRPKLDKHVLAGGYVGGALRLFLLRRTQR